ncbi:MAG: NTP transferase domain-containing protein, partial [Pseudomonadota bacterium]
MTTSQTSQRPRSAIILAAGKSTRMKSAKSKVLHELAGRPLLEWVSDAARSAGCDRIVCVVGEMNADVRAAAEKLGLEIAVQDPQLGTGHAVDCARDAFAGYEGDVAVLFADTPLIATQTLSSVFTELETSDV